ncbi:MAG: FKBP-type peptidyl-prolyl cis-trans isomerase [Sediminibacterium sp.]|nr:FKBP-type peptidyl-prolyl cis-trans isomerase [Sediminibacterium sp.]
MKKYFILLGCLVILSSQSFSQTSSKPKTTSIKSGTSKPQTPTKLSTQVVHSVKLLSEMDSVSYGIGINIAQNFKNQGLEVSLPILCEGLSSNENNRILADSVIQAVLLKFQQKMMQKKQEEMTKAAESEKEAGKAFMEANARKEGVVTLPNGLQYQIIKHSDNPNGKHPTLESKVVCHYHGTLLDGTIFDSSIKRGEPASFPLNGVIKGWQEGLQFMVPGDEFRFWIPSDLAYGDRGTGQIKPGSTLVFDVQLISVE